LKTASRDFVTIKLRYPHEQLNEINFCNIYRLPCQRDAMKANENSNTKTCPIVVKPLKMRDKCTFETCWGW